MGIRSSRVVSRRNRLAANASKLTRAFKPVLESLESRRMLSVAGDLDTTFSTDGIAGIDIRNFGSGFGASAIALQPDGSILVASPAFNGQDIIALVRYTPDGDLDDTFAGNGINLIDIGDRPGETVADIVVSGNKIYVTGSTQSGDTTVSDIFVLGLNMDGTIFDTQIISYAGDTVDQTAVGIAAASDGSLYVAGFDGLGSFLAKFLVSDTNDDTEIDDISVDQPFGGDGIQAIETNGFAVPQVSSLAIQSDNALLIGGFFIVEEDEDAVLRAGVARFVVDENVAFADTTYSDDGVAIALDTNTNPINEIASDLAVDNLGQVVVVFSSPVDLLIARFDTTGEQNLLATKTASTTETETGTESVTYSGFGIAIDPNSNAIVATGYQVDTFDDGENEPVYEYSLLLARFTPAGAPDAAFGDQGFVTFQASETSLDFGNRVAVQASGDIVVAGQTDSDVLVARFLGSDDVVVPPDPVYMLGNNLIIQGTAGNDTATVTDLGGGSVSVTLNTVVFGPFTPTGRIIVAAGDGDDSITIGGAVTIGADIDGGIGDDTLAGGGGADSILGGDNDDVINGHGGNDTSAGGAGNDDITNNSGNDQLFGDAGNDTLLAGTGDDSASGGAGNDSLSGGSGNDALHGDGDNDTINAGAGDDFVDGGSGNDDLNGQGGTDIVVGGDDNDTVQGGAERDILIGGTGADSLIGNADEDILIAGYTSHDGSILALQSTMAVWDSGDSYSMRIATLASTDFQADVTVFNDTSVDTLTGGAGTDWFFYNQDTVGGGTVIDIVDRRSSETGTDVD